MKLSVEEDPIWFFRDNGWLCEKTRHSARVVNNGWRHVQKSEPEAIESKMLIVFINEVWRAKHIRYRKDAWGRFIRHHFLHFEHWTQILNLVDEFTVNLLLYICSFRFKLISTDLIEFSCCIDRWNLLQILHIKPSTSIKLVFNLEIERLLKLKFHLLKCFGQSTWGISLRDC